MSRTNAPSPSGKMEVMSDDALLASYNVNLDDHFENESDDEGSSSALSLPSSMLDSDDEGYNAAVLSSQNGKTTTRKQVMYSHGDVGHDGNFNVGTGMSSNIGVVSENFTSKLSRMEQEITRLAHEKELLTSDLVRERKKHRDDVASLRRRNRSDFGQVRSKQAELEAEVPVLRARLEHSKETLRNLEISSALFAQLERIPETQLSVREFVQVQVHRLVKRERDENERTRREIESLRTTLSRQKVDSDRKEMDLQHRLSTSENSNELVQKELLRIQKENAELEATLNASSNNIAQLKSKGANYDTVHARATSLEREVETTRHRAELVQSSLDQMIIERDTATSKMLELKSAVEVLTVDKSYLTREVSASATKCSNLEETVNSLREEKRNLMNIKQQYQEELLKEKDDARRGYEDRLSMEVNKLQKETAMELSSIRNAQKQVHEMEIASLKDRLASAEELNATHLTELNELRQTHESLLMNTSRERNDHQSSMSELRSRLKIKAFEQGRLNLLVEEQREALASSRLSIAKHEKRFSVLRDEFVKLEAQGAKREIEHEAMLNIEREKVLGYEALEMELDGAFISGGNSSTSTLLPSSSRRRAKQSIALAEKLVRAQNDNRKLQDKVNNMKIELQAAQDETIAANHALQSVSGPEVFIVEKMKKQQERISSSNRQVVELQQENISVKREVNALRQENQELREEMRIVLAGRKQLEEMRKRVEQMRHASGGSGGSVDISNRAVVDRDVEEERDEVAAVLSTSYSSISSLPVGSPRVREVSFEDGPARVGGGGLVIQGSGSRRWHSKK